MHHRHQPLDHIARVKVEVSRPNQKQVALPADWIAGAFPTVEKRKTYAAENDLDDLPLDLADFLEFFEERTRRIRDRLAKALGATSNAG